MTGRIMEGVAFIFEGATEKVFYLSLLEYLTSLDEKISLEKCRWENDGESYYIWGYGENRICVMSYTVGAVTQIIHSGKWFKSKCAKRGKFPWTVYLCYDTDSPQRDITKFYEGDWKRLREELARNHVEQIVDLAASADIEDILLCDLEGICRYLNIDVPDELSGRKGKAKMKALYRSCGATYHEGERAKEMIRNLDFEKIIAEAPIGLGRVREKFGI